MDYGRLNRKELQALCKEHGIPANKTNAFMAEALGALHNAPKESELSMESLPDPAEVVKSKASLRRAMRSKKVVDVLDAIEVDDFSSQLAKSTLAADSENVMVGAGGEDICEAVVEALIEVVAEPAKVQRKGRTQSAKTNTKLVSSLVDPAPALVEPTLEVVLQVENPIDPPATADVVPESRSYSRRARKEKGQECSEIVDLELSSETIETALPAQEGYILTVLSPVAEIVEEETTGSANSNKSKAKGKRSKKVKPVSPISVDILEDAALPPTTESTSAAALEMPESPTLGLTSHALCPPQIQRAASISPAPGDEAFEFHPVPESFAEIMTPGKPLVEATRGCHHRLGRKSGKFCKSCASEKKVASLTQDLLQAIEVAEVDVVPLEPVCEAAEVLGTPVKEGDDKENALKNIDLHSLSIRKLQKEVKRRGLSKRNNMKVKA